MNDENFIIPTRENIESILKFLPYFSNPDNGFYEILGGEKVDGGITMPFYNYVVKHQDFITAYIMKNLCMDLIGLNCRINPFRYMKIQSYWLM